MVASLVQQFVLSIPLFCYPVRFPSLLSVDFRQSNRSINFSKFVYLFLLSAVVIDTTACLRSPANILSDNAHPIVHRLVCVRIPFHIFYLFTSFINEITICVIFQEGVHRQQKATKWESSSAVAGFELATSTSKCRDLIGLATALIPPGIIVTLLYPNSNG